MPSPVKRLDSIVSAVYDGILGSEMMQLMMRIMDSSLP